MYDVYGKEKHADAGRESPGKLHACMREDAWDFGQNWYMRSPTRVRVLHERYLFFPWFG